METDFRLISSSMNSMQRGSGQEKGNEKCDASNQNNRFKKGH